MVSDIGFWGRIALWNLTTLASIAGLRPLLHALTGLQFPLWLCLPLGFLGFGIAIYHWINAGLSGSIGRFLFLAQLILSPWGYYLWGLPLPLACLMVFLPRIIATIDMVLEQPPR